MNDRESGPELPPPTIGEHRNVNRLTLVLSTLAAAGKQGMRAPELADRVGFTRATVHRILHGMVAASLLEQDEEPMRFRVSASLLAVAGKALLRHGLLEASASHVDLLAEQVGDGVAVHVDDGRRAVCVLVRTGSFPIKPIAYGIGDAHAYANDAVSLALLAQLPGRPGAELVEARRQLDTQGFVIDEGRFRHQITTIAVPIRHADLRVVAALSVSAISTRLGPDRVPQIAPLLVAAAESVSTALRTFEEVARRRGQ